MRNEPPHDKINKMACASSEDSDQPRHPPSLIRVFCVRMKKAWVLSYPLSAQRMPRLIWVFAGRTVILFVLSWGVLNSYQDTTFQSYLTELTSEVNCTAKFGKTRTEDIEKIQSYSLSSVNHYLRQLDPVPSPGVFLSHEGPGAVEAPVLVSGASSNHFVEAGLLINHINSDVRPLYRNVPFYFFDLGLQRWQSQKVR